MVSYSAGSDEDSFAATFTASSYADAEITFQRSIGATTETRHKGTGSWTGSDGKVHKTALHNTWTSAAWFSPALVISEWVHDPEIVIADVGVEQRESGAVEHIRAYRRAAGTLDDRTAKVMADASRMDLYLDPASGSPIVLEFSTHPDGDALRNIPVRIEYAEYRSGHAYEIKRYLNGTLLLDIRVSEVGGAQ